jgi:hypothetical protein
MAHNVALIEVYNLYSFFKHPPVQSALHEARGHLMFDDAVFSYSTTVSVLNSPVAVDQIPGGQQNDFQVAPSRPFFLLLLFGSYLRLFLISCFFLPASSFVPWGLSIS